MTERPAELTAPHTRILRCTLEDEAARAYWAHASAEQPTARRAFEEYWFGSRSHSRVELLLANFRVRFDAYPFALRALSAWGDMDPDTRRLVCHWHLQLSDPLYREFTGSYLVRRVTSGRPTVTHALALAWVSDQDSGRWNMATRIQFASKLMSAARTVGLIGSTRDPRPLKYPRVGDASLTYLMFLLRGVSFRGTLLDNPYAASVGLHNGVLEDRLRGLTGLKFRRQGDLVEFGWRYRDLEDWVSSTLFPRSHARAGGA